MKRTRGHRSDRRYSSHCVAKSLIASSLALASGSGLAQQAAQGGVLDPVTVTAERRSENIKDVPSSVSTVSGEKLDVLNSSGEDVRFLSGRVPSLNIESSFGRTFPRFYIRGYGNTDFHLNASQPVSVVYDDVVQENPILKGFPVFDVDQVEVLAGPQGTLFGRNTPAGVVKFDSAKPTNRFEGYLNASYGRFSTVNTEGAINIPLSDILSARLSISQQHRNDWVSNVAPNAPAGEKYEGYDDEAARLQLLLKPVAGLSFLLNVHGREEAGTARLFRANIIKPGTNDFANDFAPNQVATDGHNKQVLESNGGSLKVRYEMGSIALSSITAYEHAGAFSRGDIDGGFGASFAPPSGPGFIPFPDETSDALRRHQQLSQEFRVESLGSGPLKYQGGVYLFNEKYGIDSATYDSLAGGPYVNSVQTHQSNTAVAVYGSVGYQVTEALNVRGGLRYTRERKFLSTTSADDFGVDTRGGLSRGTRDSRMSGDVAATYALTKDINAYARVANGFRASSLYPASDFNPLTSVPAETNTSYEIGLKGDLFDRRMRFAVSGFHYDIKHQQLSAVGGQTNSTILVSAAKTKGDGVELSLDAFVTPELLITANASYNKTKIKDPNLVVFGCAACTVTDPSAGGGTFSIDGNPLPQAPKYIANLTARYGIPFLNGEAFVYTDWSYRSKINFFLYESTEFTGKSLLLGGFRAGYVWGNGKYEAAVFGRNITNQVRIVGGIDFNNLTGFINEPRIWGAQIKAQF